MINWIIEYWVQIMFVLGILGAMIKYAHTANESVKCSLRNDILEIYDRCKKDKKITLYQLESMTYSYEQYKKLKGNSFVDEIMQEVKKWDKVD